ncbi:membrane protein insertion efficiency factor YidD [Candidatus Uhrbacteria bacterium]|nr:membrane protein insertion efficiency factor YidD [Candidatus Uhrbacteria bacterium]
MTRILLAIISLYQKTVSPDHGLFRFRYPYGFCRYAPSCSAYAHEAIRTRGVMKGILMVFWRILRCNPFSRGGFDPI